MIQNRSINQETEIQNDHTIVYADGTSKEICANILKEHFLEILVEEQRAFKIVCTPTNLEDLVLGRLVSEGLVSALKEIELLDICENGNRAKVFLTKNTKLEKADVFEATCCTGNETLLQITKTEVNPRERKAPIAEDIIFLLAKTFANGSLIHKSTKGTHCCYLAYQDQVIYAAEDIGRHNALDKAIGYAVKNELQREDCVLFTTGRVPTDMIKKVIQAGFPTLVSKAVPTNEAIELAKKYKINLICKAWPDSFEIFA